MTSHSPLLPNDAYLASLLGWSEDQLRRYQIERQQAAAREFERNPPIATCGPALPAISLALTILSVGYTILSVLLAPKPRRPGQIVVKQRQGDAISDGARYSPRPGFDSTQEVARLGSVIPVTFARREYLPALNGRPAGWYGGCRVDLDLLWSQLMGVDGAQVFRGVYSLGEGPMAEIDPAGFALGNNPLRSYDLGSASANEAAARMTIYARLGGGRIRSSDRIAGRLAVNDIGNMENAGGGDVFQLRSTGGVFRPDACAIARPSSSTACGLYSTIGNGLGYRVNPQLRPTRQINTRPTGNTGDQKIEPVDDPVALGAIWKARRMWSGRSGVIATSTGASPGFVSLPAGATFDYLLSNSSDVSTKLKFNSTNTDAAVDHTETISDVAAAISSRQRSADDALRVGELFKCGSALAVLEQRLPSDEMFVSDGDNLPVGGGRAVTARFRVVRAGIIYVVSMSEINPDGTGETQFPADVSGDKDWEWTAVDPGPRYATGTNRGHLHRCAIADFTLTKPAQIIEIILKCTLGIRGSGYTNLREAPSLREINRLAGGERDGEILSPGEKIKIAQFQSAARNFNEERYSFVRLSYRPEGSTAFVELPTIYGTRGFTQQAQHNAVQLELPGGARCAQIRMEPLSGWEIRSGVATGQLAVIDSRMSTLQTVTDGECTVRYLGEAPFQRFPGKFSLKQIEPEVDLGLGWSDLDDYSELLIYGWSRDAKDYSERNREIIFGDAVTTGNFIGLSQSQDSYISVEQVQIVGDCTVDVWFKLDTLPPDTSLGKRWYLLFASFGGGVTGVSFQTLVGTGKPFATVHYQHGTGFGSISINPVIADLIQVGQQHHLRLVNLGNNLYVYIDGQLGASGTLDPALAFSFRLNLIGADNSGDTDRFDGQLYGVGIRSVATPTVPIVPWPDVRDLLRYSNAMTDSWGKVAEVFVYDEIQSTASQGPEYEVHAINIIQTNPIAPSYESIALVGANIRSSLELQSVSQLSALINGGHICPRYIEGTDGPTHLLPDIFSRLALSTGFGAGQDVTAEQINVASFLAAAQWCFSRRYFFDGTLPEPENLRQWAADQAGLHLLSFYELNGQFYFKPALTFEPVQIVELFTAGNIKKGTFQSTTSDDDQRRPIQVTGLYRDERANDDILFPGLFSTVREITIREASASDSDPVEPLDMRASCTNRWHLIDAAKYLIRWRRLVGDPISFETTYEGMLRPIGPEDHIAVAYDETLNDLWSNGAVLEDGTLVASEPLEDGSYEVLAWDGTTPPGPTVQTLTVSGGGTVGNLLGCQWTRTAAAQWRCYRVMRVTPTDDGRQKIEAVLMPLDAQRRQLLSLDWDDPSAWVIRG